VLIVYEVTRRSQIEAAVRVQAVGVVCCEGSALDNDVSLRSEQVENWAQTT
jgi:hypothetical protein